MGFNDPMGFVKRLTLAELFELRELLASGDRQVLRRAEAETEKVLGERLRKMQPGERERVAAAWLQGAGMAFRGGGGKVRGRTRGGAGQLAAA